MKTMSGSFVNFLRVGLISSVTTITLSCVSPSHATVQILTDSFLSPNAPALGAELNDNLANRQTGTLATVGYSSNTLNTGGAGTSGFAYLSNNSKLELLPDVGTFGKVWTTTGFSTSGRTTISMDIWPTVTQINGSGFASLLVGGGLDNTKANEGVLWAGGAANAITVSLHGNGLLTMTNYTRAAGFTSDNYIGFQAYRNAGATESGFDNLNVTMIPEPCTTALLGLGGVALFVVRRRR